MKSILISYAVLALCLQANATLFQFDLRGTAGIGLLPGNESGGISGGSGGEVGQGITYDDVTNILNLTNVGWGSSQGFNNLSSLASNSHIHGPTSSNNGNGFTETASVLIDLPRSSDAVTGGVFSNPMLDFDMLFAGTAETREAQLLAGKFYINIHTVNNAGGELRGFLQVVPEPSVPGLAIPCVVAAAFLRRGKRKAQHAYKLAPARS